MRSKRAGRVMTGMLVLAVSLPAMGCLVRTRAPAYVVDVEPPPPQYERIETRPGYVWVKGSWEWDGAQWQWRRGHWQAQRSGYAWRDGHWERRGRHWHWVEGNWETAEGGAVIRDHRRQPYPPQPQPYTPPPGSVIVPSEQR